MNATNTTTTTTTGTPSRANGSRARRTDGPAAPDLVITEHLHASGAVFKIHPDRIEDMKNRALDNGAEVDSLPNFPVMSGNIFDEAGMGISVSVFLEAAKETGEVYASLSLGGKDRTKYYGKLFSQSQDNGPDYSGFIVVLPVDQPDQYSEEAWDKAPKLQVCGWRRRNANGQPRISLSIAPRVVAEGELPL